MKNLIIYSISLLSLLACEPIVVKIERPDFNPSIVVGSILSPGLPISIQLSEDQYILDGDRFFPDFNEIEGATISFFENDQMIGEISGSDTDYDDTIYTLDFYPTKGNEYRIEVVREGYASVSATETIPSDQTVFSVESYEIHNNEYGNLEARINVDIEDSEGDDYYQFNLYLEYNESNGTDRIREQQDLYFENEILFEEHLSEDVLLFDDALFRNSTYELGFNHEVDTYDSSDDDLDYTLVIEIRKVSEAYYNYYNSALLQSSVEGNPFAEPVQVFSNIENGKGVLGSFIPGTTVEIPLELSK